ncbi:ventricular zone-expressed PH domain-containing protein homolog 1 [Protopterus annectens]|uniref:ventricular zone-expressed PH domain-containing protein homolog 1 n=1 Tax=Protopterus annectens TaxID=7888 RepID=UPI001CFB11F6|nr:ventricular zone-expressed PH domain-containing protein homolog 1 [Protopterus annectens]XP_043926419.1 ventricular zone-expressed PH domain-containing protein homolog 1 [Protopterus annectens]
MHYLFSLVLGQRDLSRAGDLFSLEDTEIEDSLSEALEHIKIISSSSTYLNNDNDQAVVEICITRITTAIRETQTIDKHGEALATLWESCLEHNLNPVLKDEDTPHAKIASDIMSCILQNYNRPRMMSLAIPVAVKFLQRGNKELCRNMSSYLSLAAIAKAELLVDHTEAIVQSILQGNYMLLRVLPSIYEKQPELIDKHVTEMSALLSQLEQTEKQHLLRLLHLVAEQQAKVLNESISMLVGCLLDTNHGNSVLNILVEVSNHEPSTLTSFLPRLAEAGENCPNMLGQIAKIYGAVGCVDEEKARVCLTYLVNQLANMEHSFHHILLLEIKNITDSFSNILGTQSKDIYRMSNSFISVAKLLFKQLEKEDTSSGRLENDTSAEQCSKPDCLTSGFGKNEGDEKLHIKVQAFEEKINNESSSPGLARRYSLGHASKEDKNEITFYRSKSFPLHAVHTKSTSSDNGQDVETGDMIKEIPLSDSDQQFEVQEAEKLKLENPSSLICNTMVNSDKESLSIAVNNNCKDSSSETGLNNHQCQDKLYMHLKQNFIMVKAYFSELLKRIPIPEQCTIEDAPKICAKISFSCSKKGNYCLYSKSSFIISSQEPQVWIRIMFLFQQSLSSEPLSIDQVSVQELKALWEKAQLRGMDNFETTIVQSTLPNKKDLEHVQMQLEEVRFFDLFGYSDETGAWQCFMCNNPEKATVVNLEGQPLIEGKLKEKQVRWKFIKRWKTRYFTLAGNQLLFRKGKSKDDPDECPIELSKVQSVKVVAKKRRDRSLPRAFEIFADNKTYVFKAKDEKNAEEWLQCINVAVAQARERGNREATTYL